MNKKFLNEKGAVKVWVIVLVIILFLAVAGGIFAVVKITGDKKDDDEGTSQSSEKKNKKSDDKDDDDDKDKDDKDEKDEKDSKDSKDKDDKKDENDKDSKKSSKAERHFKGDLDMSETAGLEGTEWTMDLYGTDETISKLVLTIDMEELIKKTYETVKDSYSYDQFIDLMQSTMEKSVDGFEESFTSSLGASKANVEGKVKWVSDEILELTISLDGLTPEDLDIDLDDDDSVIEAVVKELEDSADVKLKEVK